MAGNAVVESVFGWPGIGNYAVKALMLKDFESDTVLRSVCCGHVPFGQFRH